MDDKSNSDEKQVSFQPRTQVFKKKLDFSVPYFDNFLVY